MYLSSLLSHESSIILIQVLVGRVMHKVRMCQTSLGAASSLELNRTLGGCGCTGTDLHRPACRIMGLTAPSQRGNGFSRLGRSFLCSWSKVHCCMVGCFTAWLCDAIVPSADHSVPLRGSLGYFKTLKLLSLLFHRLLFLISLAG